MSRDEPIRIGVIGAGAVTSTIHLPILTRRQDLFLVAALYDLNFAAVNALGDRFGIREEDRYSDFPTMLANAQLDAVIILNSGSHANLVIAALDAGLDVFSEKPLVYSQREFNEITEALQRSRAHLMVGYMKSHDLAVLRAAELIATQGPARTVDVLVLHSSGDSQLETSEISLNMPPVAQELLQSYQAAALAIELEVLGPLALELGPLYSNILSGSLIHELSVLRALGLEISVINWVDRWPKKGVTESIIVFGESASGVRITLRWFYLENYPQYREEILWVGEKSSHLLQFPSPYFLRVPTVLSSISGQSQGINTQKYESYFGAFENELQEFHTMVRTSQQRGSDISTAASDLRVLQQIIRKIAQLEGLPLGGDLL